MRWRTDGDVAGVLVEAGVDHSNEGRHVGVLLWGVGATIVAEMGSVELMKQRRRRNNNSRTCLGEDDFEQDVVALGEALVEGEVLLDLGIVIPPKQLHVPLHDFQS